MNNIRVLLLEDDPVWRSTLAEFLAGESGLEVMAAVDSVEEAIARCKRDRVHVALLDTDLAKNEVDGIKAAAEIHLLRRNIKIIMITSLSSSEIILDAFIAGAIHFIPKTDFRELPGLIRKLAGDGELTPQEILINEFHKLKQQDLTMELTAAEKNILSLLQEGRTHSEIQQQLHIAESTLKNQIGKILKKIGVKSAKEAVKKINSRGILYTAARQRYYKR